MFHLFWFQWYRWPLRGGKAIIASVLSECVITPYMYMKGKRRGGRSGRKAAGGKGCAGWAFRCLLGHVWHHCNAYFSNWSYPSDFLLWRLTGPSGCFLNRKMMYGGQTPHREMFFLLVPCSPNWIRNHPWQMCSFPRIRRLRRQSCVEWQPELLTFQIHMNMFYLSIPAALIICPARKNIASK